jgi:hypothetical protein
MKQKLQFVITPACIRASVERQETVVVNILGACTEFVVVTDFVVPDKLCGC